MRTRFTVLISLIFAMALYRVLPHPPNFSPVAAMALFGGAYFMDKRVAFIVPFIALIISDLIIGFHNSMLFVYGGFALTVVIGMWLHNKINLVRLGSAALGSSVLFFLITNFGAWMASEAPYPMTAAGLMQAYIAGIPFFQNTLVGNIVFSAILFGGFVLLQKNISSLKSAHS